MILPQHHTVQPQSLASQSALFDPYCSKVPMLSGESEKPRGTLGTTAGYEHLGRLPVMQKDWRDKGLLPSPAAVVNQANHSTPEFRAYDPNASLRHATAVSLSNKYM